MRIDISTPVASARFLVRLGIYELEAIEATLVNDFSISSAEAHEIVAQAVEFDKCIDA